VETKETYVTNIINQLLNHANSLIPLQDSLRKSYIITDIHMTTVTKFIAANHLFYRMCNIIEGKGFVEEDNLTNISVVSEIDTHDHELLKRKQKLAKSALKLRKANDAYKKIEINLQKLNNDLNEYRSNYDRCKEQQKKLKNLQYTASEPIMQVHIIELAKFDNPDRKLLLVSLVLKELLNIQFEEWEDFQAIC